MQTGNQWTRKSYPIYSIIDDILDISRVHRQERHFRQYDTSNTFKPIKVNDNLSLVYPELRHSKKLFMLIEENKYYFSETLAWPEYVNEISDSVTFIEQSRLDNQNKKALVLFLMYKSNIAGVISFNSIDIQNRTAYIGYWLGKSYQGKGIITEALNRLIHDYSSTGMINRFVIKCVIDNIKSNAVALRCGFTLEGVLRKAEVLNGIAHDQNIYSKIIR